MDIFLIVIFSAAALAVLCGAVYIVFFTRRRSGIGKRVLVTAAALISEVLLAFGIYVNIYYKADDTARAYLEDRGSVHVVKNDRGWLFDGAGEKDLLIFYHGGKVEAEAYAPLMSLIAERGCDCFLTDMPMRLPIFDISAAGKMIGQGGYERFFLGGHSLGGVAASKYAAANADKLSGLILLAAYPADSLPDTLPCLSVYGSEDRVLNMEEYRAAEANFPTDTETVVIDGGNHGQFGSYGAQSGDGEPKISPEAQWEQTAEAVSALLSHQ